jgi:choline-glycine betaine transporter
MLGWWIALGCFTISIDGLRRGINFLSVYTTVLSFVLLFLMILLGRVSGRSEGCEVIK